jgi:hypothetical protein
MKRKLLLAAAIVLGPFVLFFVLFAVLSEAGEVVVIRTGGGETRETRIWVVDTPDGLLVRGTGAKGWVAAARAEPRVELRRGDAWLRLRAVEQTGADARERANRLMLEKYGVAERMVALVRDLDESVPFLLVPEP